MRRLALKSLLPLGTALLFVRVLSCAVPVAHRGEWRDEWRGELQHVSEASQNSIELLRFTAGACPDALCLLFEARADRRARPMPARRCLLMLTSFVALLTGFAFSLPSVRAEFRQVRWHTSQEVSVLFLPNPENEAAATITPERFDRWKQVAHFLPSLGFYQIAQQEVTLHNRSARLRVAHVTGDASVMGVGNLTVPVQGRPHGRLVLSRQVWQRRFGGELPARGSPAEIDGRAAYVAGVADLEDSGLPGGYDAWLFDGRPPQPGVPGFVIGRFAAGTPTNPYFGFQHFAIRETQTSEVSGLAFPVAERKANPWYTLGLGLALSLLALPATTPMGFGERVRSEGRVSGWQVARRWLFLLVKCLLCAGMASAAALIVASIFSQDNWRWALATRILVAFAAMLIGLRWSILDQRGRCPACLQQLTNPASVGEPSRTFLSWNGTELACVSGHGLMHVPAHATSWFRAQRWLALDPSWRFLFAQKR